MKKFFLFCAFSSVLFSCKKSSDSGNNLQYSVNNIVDINLGQYSDTTLMLPLYLQYTSGTQEAINTALTGLPGGVSVSPASISGTPSYTAVFKMHCRTLTAGTFPVTVSTKGALSGTKTLGFNIIVSPRSDCKGLVTGTYSETTSCDTINTFSATISAGPSDNTVVIFDMKMGGSFNASIDCTSQTITIPEVSTWGGTFSGTGSYSETGAVINWHVTPGGGAAYDCIATYTR